MAAFDAFDGLGSLVAWCQQRQFSTAAGSTPDIVGRLVGEQLAAAVGQSVVVENRAGPGGIAAIQALAASAADGQTLALVTVNQAVFNSYLFSKLPYDSLQDIEPISLLAFNSFSVGVQKSFGPNTFSELVAAAQAQPGKLAVGTAPPGTAPHVFAHVLARMIGIKMTFVPYRSGLEGITGLMRGDIQVLLDSPAVCLTCRPLLKWDFRRPNTSRGLVSLLRHARHLASWPGSTSQRRPSWRLLGFGNVLRR